MRFEWTRLSTLELGLIAKLDEPVDRPQEMIRWNVRFEREFIEQRSLVDLAMFHHDLQSCTSQRLNKRTSSRATADFFNKIDPCRTQTCFRPDPYRKGS